MNKRGNYSRKSTRSARKRRNIFILICVFLFLIGGIGIYSAVSDGNETKEVQANQDNKDEKNKNSDNHLKELQEDTKKQDNNSGYIPLGQDPNADDAQEVAKMTQDLMKGKAHYPVRKDGKKVVYITFDDGPSTTNTPEILDILDKYNVKATFFMLGSSIDKNEEAKNIVKRVAEDGHAIANHTYSHNYSYLYPGRVINGNRFIGEVEKTNKSLKAILGEDFSTKTIRFPGGYWSWNGRSAVRPILDKDGYAIVDWNALNGDAEARGKTASMLISETKDTVDKLGPNADNIVFLMHDTYGKEETVKALPEIIEYFKDKGFEFRTMK